MINAQLFWNYVETDKTQGFESRWNVIPRIIDQFFYMQHNLPGILRRINDFQAIRDEEKRRMQLIIYQQFVQDFFCQCDPP